ncbi:MAG TPA: polyketide cyclase [Bacteroidetes bacterium]|nr:polyketide cyclase [Bacteroidota bacterium]
MNNLTKYSWITTAIILIIGFLFLHFKIVDYGYTFFMVFPFAVGFSMGTLEKKKRQLSYLIFGILVFFGFLLAGALEGLICVLMALPIFILMVFLGYWVQKKTIKKEADKTQRLMISIAPIIVLLLLNPVEQVVVPKSELITIKTSVELNYPPDIVFDNVKKMDKLDAARPIGMHLGLPAPYRCELEADTIGALRNCLFKSGKIVAQITKYEKGKILEMDVIDYTLTGRDWFHFVDATYTFKEKNGMTKITRTSSYRSSLNPRFYWQALEKWGIEQEHGFVLNSLKKNLKEKYGN